MILFELLPMKSNLQRNTGATLLEILACRQQKWKEKIASSRKPSIKQEKPQAVMCFRAPVVRIHFILFSFILLKMQLFETSLFPYKGAFGND